MGKHTQEKNQTFEFATALDQILAQRLMCSCALAPQRERAEVQLPP